MIYNLFGERDGWAPIDVEPTPDNLGSHLDSMMFFGHIQGRLVLIHGAGRYPAREMGLDSSSYINIAIGGVSINGASQIHNVKSCRASQ